MRRRRGCRVGELIIPLRLESKEQAVERSLEQSLWVVLDSGSLHGCERGVATVGQRGLGVLVLGLAA